MAQVVGYTENNVVFTEGPFVLCNPYGNGWRVEVELVGHKCPVLPDPSIYKVMENFNGKDFARAVKVCDYLNELVRDGIIAKQGAWWVYAG